MTRGFVRARYALALRAIPIFPGSREAFSGVSVVLTVAVTLFCLAVQSGWFSQRRGPKAGPLPPAVASEYHTVALRPPEPPHVRQINRSSRTPRDSVIHIRKIQST
jgi:hypothetical protein